MVYTPRIACTISRRSAKAAQPQVAGLAAHSIPSNRPLHSPRRLAFPPLPLHCFLLRTEEAAPEGYGSDSCYVFICYVRRLSHPRSEPPLTFPE